MSTRRDNGDQLRRTSEDGAPQEGAVGRWYKIRGVMRFMIRSRPKEEEEEEEQGVEGDGEGVRER